MEYSYVTYLAANSALPVHQLAHIVYTANASLG